MLSLEYVDDLSCVALIFNIETKCCQYSTILESLVEFNLHNVSLLALTDPFNIVPPFVKHLSELELSESVEPLFYIV